MFGKRTAGSGPEKTGGFVEPPVKISKPPQGSQADGVVPASSAPAVPEPAASGAAPADAGTAGAPGAPGAPVAKAGFPPDAPPGPELLAAASATSASSTSSTSVEPAEGSVAGKFAAGVSPERGLGEGKDDRPGKAPERRALGGAVRSEAAGSPRKKVETTRPNLYRSVEEYYEVKSSIFNALIDAVDMTQLAQMDKESAREEIRDVVNEIVAIKHMVMSIAEQEKFLRDICDDVLGYGPLEPLLERDDIDDIMVNSADRVYIEVNGKIELTDTRFRDNEQLMNICQRIVSQVGRRVDESSPICDARLADGSRVNVIASPLAIDGPSLTIRKFKKEKLTLRDLVRFGSITAEGAEILGIIGRCRCNVVVSGGTGSGKTTLLNCLTAFIEEDERVITCEDTAELQLQQPHVVRLETRPPNLEGKGEVTMRDLVKNCLRMRPERIIVGEVRGMEAFDLLQAMNTGHDGSMGTLHANSPREALSRLEGMVTMGGFGLPSSTIREMISGSVDVIVQAARLRDGTRKITHITEVLGMEEDVITTQDLLLYDIEGEGADGRLYGRHRANGIVRPKFWERARYYNEERNLEAALEASEI